MYRRVLIGGDGFDKYAVNILRPQNTEIGEPELNNVGEKSQNKNDTIIHNNIINARWNQISDMIHVFDPLFKDS